MRCQRCKSSPPHDPRTVPPCRCGFISTCRQLLQHFVEAHFPTNKALEVRAAAGAAGATEQGWYDGGDGSESTWQAASEDASPGQQRQQQGGQAAGEEDPTSAELKAAMQERIAALDLPPNFLDEVKQRGAALGRRVGVWAPPPAGGWGRGGLGMRAGLPAPHKAAGCRCSPHCTLNAHRVPIVSSLGVGRRL